MQTWILVLLFRITTLNMRRILLNKVHHYGVRGIMMAGFLHIYWVVNKQQKLVLKIFLKEINKNLSWKNHLVHLASKISKAISIIVRLRHFVPLATPSDPQLLYMAYAYQLSSLVYCLAQSRGAEPPKSWKHNSYSPKACPSPDVLW